MTRPVTPYTVLDGIRQRFLDAGDDEAAERVLRDWNQLIPIITEELRKDGEGLCESPCGIEVCPADVSTMDWSKVKPDTSTLLPLDQYDRIVIGFSGGKDSIACTLVAEEGLRRLGVDPHERIELWHHHVDGGPNDPPAFDWPCTPSYCQAVADALGYPLRAQWREGGILGWATREPMTPTGRTVFELAEGGYGIAPNAVAYVKHRDIEEGVIESRGRLLLPLTAAQLAWFGKAERVLGMSSPLSTAALANPAQRSAPGKAVEWQPGMERDFPPPVFIEHRGALAYHPAYVPARRAFPFPSPDLNIRWCSERVKISVASQTFTSDPRFDEGKFLILTGERREEGRVSKDGNPTGRASYATVVKHSATRRGRRVDQWRPVLDCTEAQVWDLVRSRGIVPHPCYHLGFSRCSCMVCIFLRDSEVATVADLDAARVALISSWERRLGLTISTSRQTLAEIAAQFDSFAPRGPEGTRWRRLALSEAYDGPVLTDPGRWRYPLGAFRHGSGPT